MKLKKIVSLALAGILAVSMLTACGDKGSSSSEGETEVTPVTGVAATVNANLDSNKEKISFDDDEILTRLMENYFEDHDVPTSMWSASNLVVVAKGDFSDLLGDVRDYLGASKDYDFGYLFDDGAEDEGDRDGSYAEMYVLSGKTFTEEEALNQVAKHIDNLNMYTEGDTNSAGVNDTDYTYTGKVAAVEAKSEGGTKNVWVVVVEITRDSAAK